GARERLHAVVGEHRIAITVRGMARGAGAAGAARDLEGDDDALANLEAAHRIAELEDLGDTLVAKREGSTGREQAGGEEEIDVAPRDGERTDEGFAVSLEPRRGNVLPSDGVWCVARELLHGRQLTGRREATQTTFPHVWLRGTQPLRLAEALDHCLGRDR